MLNCAEQVQIQKCKTHANKALRTAGVQTIMLEHPTKQLKKKLIIIIVITRSRLACLHQSIKSYTMFKLFLCIFLYDCLNSLDCLLYILVLYYRYVYCIYHLYKPKQKSAKNERYVILRYNDLAVLSLPPPPPPHPVSL